MIETMPICFCYKAIHSFFTIFHDENHYDLIKELVLNIKSPSTDLERKIKEYQSVILLIFNCKVLTEKEVARVSYYVNNETPGSFATINNILTSEDIFESCNQMLNADVSTSITGFTVLSSVSPLRTLLPRVIALPSLLPQSKAPSSEEISLMLRASTPGRLRSPKMILL